jgi:hypothetical protein
MSRPDLAGLKSRRLFPVSQPGLSNNRSCPPTGGFRFWLAEKRSHNLTLFVSMHSKTVGHHFQFPIHQSLVFLS